MVTLVCHNIPCTLLVVCPRQYTLYVVSNSMAHLMYMYRHGDNANSSKGIDDMKIKAIKCGICSNWYGSWRGHCNVCSATRIPCGNHASFHIDTSTGRVIANGIQYKYNMIHWALQIAQELSRVWERRKKVGVGSKIDGLTPWQIPTRLVVLRVDG